VLFVAQPDLAPPASRSTDRPFAARILRLYGPLEPWFDKSWRPGEIELVK
jgi:hypothetical protein